jgi:hypothetical protein
VLGAAGAVLPLVIPDEEFVAAAFGGSSDVRDLPPPPKPLYPATTTTTAAAAAVLVHTHAIVRRPNGTLLLHCLRTAPLVDDIPQMAAQDGGRVVGYRTAVRVDGDGFFVGFLLIGVLVVCCRSLPRLYSDTH